MSDICENCERIVTPPPRPVTLTTPGKAVRTRRLCSACRCHAVEQFHLPAPWLAYDWTERAKC